MIQYVENVIIPYVERTLELAFEEDTPALVIIDNFKGQMTSAVTTLLETNDIHVCPLPPYTTDLLQPMDVSVQASKRFSEKAF